ncbi:MAG: hypothetical protein LDL51_00460 [Chloroflexi bacterium]|nr:hypothetical protein [Chloroflexota bacterium]
MSASLEKKLFKIAIPFLAAAILYRAAGEFHEIAWGTGNWRGEFSLTWAFLYYAFIAFCVLAFSFALSLALKPAWFSPAADLLTAARERMGKVRWLLWILLFILPLWFFQYTALGFVFQKFYIRVLIWILVVFLMTFLASKGKELAGWNEFLASLILTASAFSVAASLKYVNAYPFSMGWSEGNRLWDYSVLFGRERYLYPADKNIPVFLDFGRSLIGGLLFLIPGVNIAAVRAWVGTTLILPYLLLGAALFRAFFKNKTLWLLLVLWTFLFLKQGPIHPPLVLSAAAVALAWNAPLWFAVPLVAGAGYFVEASRFTWVFAPAIWIVMLEFSSAVFTPAPKRETLLSAWMRSALLGLAGVFGSFALPNIFGSAGTFFPWTAPAIVVSPAEATSQPAAAELPPYLADILQKVTDQPLLWYRLLPNSTYTSGILLALLFAVIPLTLVLLYLAARRIWRLSPLQKAALLLPLLAFLAVGLVASAKIGGGGDLHNMDMFLIGMLFTAAVAWKNGGMDWIQNGALIPSAMKVVVVAMLVNSSLAPLLEMRSFTLGEDAAWLKTLTDAKSEAALEMLPTQAEIDLALQTIQTEADKAKTQGEVLFMDQRQLLTFGYIRGVPLIPEYEKKLLMNEALSGNAAYFRGYYADLAAKRFSLIITEPLRTPVKDSSYEFGEENNAWVKWVASPTLCFYEPLATLKNVRVQLLVPKQGEADCSAELPKESLP